MRLNDTARVVHIEVVCGRQLLVLRRATSDSLPNYWEIPGGSLEPGESFAQAASRELEEETGIRPNNLMELLRLAGPAPPGFDRPKIESALFRTALERRPTVRIDPTEHTEFRWVLPADLRKLRMMDINRTLAILGCAYLRSLTPSDGAV
jgi:8-oxo-dGTP pyrophosphatase MutT (NUDIX family)